LLDYLQRYEGGLILTSHDRYFLDNLVQRVLLLESGKLDIYHGNYSQYEIKREEALEHLRGAFARQQKELKKQSIFIEKNRARAATASNVQSRIKQVAKIELVKLPPEPPKIKLRFPEPRSSGQLAFRATELAKSYGDLKVFSDLNLELPAGEKLAVVGVNGAGKSTLLKLITGDEKPTGGELKIGHNVLIQTFSQYANDLPNEDWSLLQAMEDAAPADCTINRRTILGSFLFQNDDVHKQIKVLSGGERARLKLARMLMRPSNLLILDEPTNHLDLHSKDVLLNALQAFQGTVLFVSHDRDFLEALATSVLQIEEGHARLFPCTYQQYRWRLGEDERERQAASKSKSKPGVAQAPKAKAKQDKEQRKQRSRADKQAARDRKRELRKAKESVDTLQTELETQEARVTELEELMAVPGFFDSRETSEPVVFEHKQLQMLIGAGYEELEAALERVEAAEKKS
jgi:ATP-binding cassette subfamily F protein 3